MVKIINHGLKPLSRRIGTGQNVWFPPGQEVEVTDKALIEELRSKKVLGILQIKDPVGKKNVGGGLKTGSRKPKSGSKAIGAKPKKEVKCPKRSYKCKDVCECDTVKKPKGLKKSKRAD
tara:strand:- start:439 stop:795 length:357 start_codon:yes stop_codon:yes gene_type:complete